jgi:hypothetical protein
LDGRRIDQLQNRLSNNIPLRPSIAKLINLSGDQQKCLIAMWMGIAPGSHLCEPTAG